MNPVGFSKGEYRGYTIFEIGKDSFMIFFNFLPKFFESLQATTDFIDNQYVPMRAN